MVEVPLRQISTPTDRLWRIGSHFEGIIHELRCHSQTQEITQPQRE